MMQPASGRASPLLASGRPRALDLHQLNAAHRLVGQGKASEDPMRSLPVFQDLRAFLDWCAARGDLLRIAEPVSLRHETTAVASRVLQAGGPILRFDAAHDPQGPAAIPVIANLFGTRARVAAVNQLTGWEE